MCVFESDGEACSLLAGLWLQQRSLVSQIGWQNCESMCVICCYERSECTQLIYIRFGALDAYGLTQKR